MRPPSTRSRRRASPRSGSSAASAGSQRPRAAFDARSTGCGVPGVRRHTGRRPPLARTAMVRWFFARSDPMHAADSPSDPLRFLLNGEPVTVTGVPPQTTLLEYLREHRGLCGSKEGCAEGDCGACTVVIAQDEGARLAWK